MAEEEVPLTEDGGLVTHPTQVLLGQIQAQTLLVAGTVVASMAVDHPMIGNDRLKIKELSRFRYEK
ncbi:MAG: hypothetical protein Q616_SPPC00691G0003 [Streptococcus parasanguinis DORA_23_24]|nr:MAG: hypothetical protein Q616_SPPC00691G0003 [Streptococcus parasanguinis DORA_23_24]